MAEAAGEVSATAPPGGTATAQSSPPAIQATVVEHGEPSNLPELGWFWRRLYVFVVTLALCVHVYLTTRGLKDPAALREVIRNDQGLIALFALLYLAGANTEAIAKLMAAVRTSRKETATITPAAVAAPPAMAPPARIVDAEK